MAHGASAPCAIESSGSGTTSSGSISSCEPRPVQRWQAPCGALNEKIRGSSSGIEVPHFRQANFSEKVSVSPSPPSRSTIVTATIPSASAAAVSIESTSRLRTSGRITSRSTTTAISCLTCFCSTISSSSPRSSPSTCTRAKPSDRSSSSSLPYSPLRPRTTGASTMKRVPSANSSTWSVICSIDCPAIRAPQTWQWGTPIRAHSRRR